MWARSPLWLRLMTSVMLLAAVALLISGFAGGRLLRSYLLDRTDDRLLYAADTAETADLQPGAHAPNPYHYRVIPADGSEPLIDSETRFGAAPKLPSLTLEQTKDRHSEPFTTDSVDGDIEWRAVAIEGIWQDDVNPPQPVTLLVATPLEDLDDTVAKLRGINLLVGFALLGGLAAAGYWMIRTSLRPLLEIEETAGAIARGDLTRRVPHADLTTEVGRLGYAFNTMLDQIETAFHDREQSETTARRSEAKMRQFVGDASHELRTPLTSIRGFAELYGQGAVTDTASIADLLRRIEDEATRMGLLVDDLLLLARLDQERPLASEPVDMPAVVREAVTAARAVAPDRTIELTVGLDGENEVVVGDESRLRQAVTNLLDNALRHTPDGTLVEVDLSRGEHDGESWVEVEVRDHGAGLTPEQADRVFERFYRVDSGRPRSTGGSGLGLAIVSGVVAAHGGRAEVDSTPGEGATFRLLLPLREID